MSEYFANFVFGADFLTYCDSDNDGILDKNDLDSDNDGIYDIIEGGDGCCDLNNDGVESILTMLVL